MTLYTKSELAVMRLAEILQCEKCVYVEDIAQEIAAELGLSSETVRSLVYILAERGVVDYYVFNGHIAYICLPGRWTPPRELLYAASLLYLYCRRVRGETASISVKKLKSFVKKRTQLGDLALKILDNFKFRQFVYTLITDISIMVRGSITSNIYVVQKQKLMERLARILRDGEPPVRPSKPSSSRLRISKDSLVKIFLKSLGSKD